jgi:hypothetical protein
MAWTMGASKTLQFNVIHTFSLLMLDCLSYKIKYILLKQTAGTNDAFEISKTVRNDFCLYSRSSLVVKVWYWVRDCLTQLFFLISVPSVV